MSFSKFLLSKQSNISLGDPPLLLSTSLLLINEVWSHQEYANPTRPCVMGSPDEITDGLFLLLDDVPVTHPISRDVTLPVDRVEVVVLAESRNVRLGSGLIISGRDIVRTSPEISSRSHLSRPVMDPVDGLVRGSGVSDVEQVFVRTDADLSVLEKSGGG